MAVNNIKINSLNYGERGYLIGLLVGDGYLYHDRWRHYKINFYLNPKKDEDIANYVLKLLKKINTSPYIMHNHGCLILRANSKILYQYLKRKVNEIKYMKNKQFRIGFISGFVDSDGYVKKGDIVISNIKKEFIDITKKYCEDLGIYTNVWQQKVKYKNSFSHIWRLRIGTNFKYEKHYSQKINRAYGGAAAHHSE